jgi:hypothetical protein
MTINNFRHAFICLGWWIGLPAVFWLFAFLLVKDLVR